MGRQLKLYEIERRRAELVNRAQEKRMALSDNRLWTSRPFLIVEYLLDSGRSIGVGYSVLQYGSAILAASFPNKTLRWAARSLTIWMALNSIRKKFLQ